MTNTPESRQETTHSATDSKKCYEMERKYRWKLKRIDEYPDKSIFQVDCIFFGDVPFPNYMEDDDDDQ
jgi:hypothetical protein